MNNPAPFDPWDWLGVHSGGFHRDVDQEIIGILEAIREDELHSPLGPTVVMEKLICTLLCNTDAFEFTDDPTQLRFVGDERFQTLDQLIDAWDDWYGEHYK